MTLNGLPSEIKQLTGLRATSQRWESWAGGEDSPMGKRARSAVSGRFVTKATARRQPSTTVVESTKRHQGRTEVTVARSAKTGRFVTMATAARRPHNTLVETIKR